MLDWLIKMEDGVTRGKVHLKTKTEVFWSHPKQSDCRYSRNKKLESPWQRFSNLLFVMNRVKRASIPQQLSELKYLKQKQITSNKQKRFPGFYFYGLVVDCQRLNLQKQFFSYFQGSLNKPSVLQKLLICMIFTSPFINHHSILQFFPVIIHFGYCTSSRIRKTLL